jgi:hypothetical protein
MPVPLPFPRLFGTAVTRCGSSLSHSQPQQQQQQQPHRPANNGAPATSHASDAVVSVPELTRLAADAQFREVLQRQRRQLASAAGEHLVQF